VLKIVPDFHPTGQYDPELEAILLPNTPKYKEKSPMVFGHEFWHWRHGHEGEASTLSAIMQEKDAWRSTLTQLPPEEIDVEFLKSVWDINIENWKGQTEDERIIDFARQSKRELVTLARRRRGG